MGDYMYDWQEPFKKWQRERERDPGPVPEDADLDTLRGLEAWLTHPANWRKTDLFIVGWEGLVPWLSQSHAWKLAPECNDRQGLLEVILYERRHRRLRGQRKDDEGHEPAEE